MSSFFITVVSGAGKIEDLGAVDLDDAKKEAQGRANADNTEYALYRKIPGEPNQLIDCFHPEE